MFLWLSSYLPFHLSPICGFISSCLILLFLLVVDHFPFYFVSLDLYLSFVRFFFPQLRINYHSFSYISFTFHVFRYLHAYLIRFCALLSYRHYLYSIFISLCISISPRRPFSPNRQAPWPHQIRSLPNNRRSGVIISIAGGR